MTKRKIKYLISIINIPRFLIHYILLGVFYKECKDDIKVAMRLRKYPEHDNILCMWGGILLDFNYLMTFDKYYRAVFYKRIGYLKYICSWLAPAQETFTIGTYAPIGRGLLCVHPYATNINAKSVGEFFIIKNNVTIGEKNGDIPTIGNNVLINVNSVIVGGITIGDNVVIGACTLIMKNVPNNCVVVGNPAYIIKQNGVACKIKL